MSDSPQPYRVLARKYRPQTFSELIGQDAMVQTLGNAIIRGRLAHAYLMTGVRGVGKTSTARLIAKALNCIGPDGDGGPAIDPCGVCEPCRAIAEGRHIDVIEMDAASHTGVDDVREIIEASRYAAVSARYKIYIIDEVHMLSKNAFNALLKTLEEPPAHVKFVFATTEVNKVPVTVLSRCQRFDLRRITTEMLDAHFKAVLANEDVSADDEAVYLIAVAAEGSVRDGLSLLDQAIAHANLDGEARVTADQVRAMLGLSDVDAVRRLFAHLLGGDAPALIDGLRDHYALGAEPLGLVRGLLDLCHAVTLAKVGRAADNGLVESERAQVAEWSGRIGYATLHRLWQLLLKAHDEVARAAMPLDALEMSLLRVCYAATLPDPGEIARGVTDIGHSNFAAERAPPEIAAERPAAAPPEPSAPDLPSDAAAIVELLYARGYARLGQIAHDHLSIIQSESPALTIAENRAVDQGFARELAEALGKLTDAKWRVELGQGDGAPTLLEIQQRDAQDDRDRLMALPVVAAAFEHFPGAELLTGTDNTRKAG